MALGQLNVLALLENALPFLAGLVEKAVDSVVCGCLVGVLAEFHLVVGTNLLGLLFIPDFREDEFEYLVEFVLSAIGKDELFKLFNDVPEIELSLEDENVIKEEIDNIDNSSIELLQAFGLQASEVEELEVKETPFVATLAANGLVEYLETVDAVNPEMPVPDIPKLR